MICITMVRTHTLNGKPCTLDALRHWVAGARANGASYKDIIEDPTNSISCKQTIINYCKWVENGGPLMPPKPMGRPKKLTSTDLGVRRLARNLERENKTTAVAHARRRRVHVTTMLRWLKANGMGSFVAQPCLYLSDRAIRLRDKWRKVTVHRSFKRTLYSDEVAFKGEMIFKQRVIRRRGHVIPKNRTTKRGAKPKKGPRYRDLLCNLAARFPKGKTLMVWGVIGWNYKPPLVCFNLRRHGFAVGPDGRTVLAPSEGPPMNRYPETVTAAVYRNQILVPHLGPRFAECRARGTHDMVVEDGARPHAAGLADDARRTLGIVNQMHPPSSPELNAIEHLWGIVKRHLAKDILNGFRWSSLIRLWKRIQYHWDRIPMKMVNRVV